MASAALASLVLHIVLALYLIQALLKMAVLSSCRTRPAASGLHSIYTGRQIALDDAIVLFLMLVFVGLLVAAGGPGYLSFITGLVVGMTLIQVYFHRFSGPVPPEQMPGGAGDAHQADLVCHPSEPRQAWREYAIMTALLVWALYALVTRAFGLFG